MNNAAECVYQLLHQATKLVRLAVDSVEAAGGAINMSGIYPPSGKLCEYVESLRKTGFI